MQLLPVVILTSLYYFDYDTCTNVGYVCTFCYYSTYRSIGLIHQFIMIYKLICKLSVIVQ